MTTCRACEDPLTLQVEDEETEQLQSVPDDLQLPCGCHFHWQCLLDQSTEVAVSLKCPSCGTQLAANAAGPSVMNPFLHSSPEVSIPTRYTSEGGVDENLDILPTITEEAYLAANPEARPARAYHVMCAEGDVEGIIELLRDAEQGDGEEPAMAAPQLIRYQDPLANMKSGLHLAMERGQEEVVWLLLWMASTLPTHAFPEAAVQAAQAVGIQRLETSPSKDIRALKDGSGRSAEDVAAEMDGVWAALLQAGVLHPGA
ncbi:hypothetical protein DL765_004122 [Monosporascus sp. GIB2]|nr:hypothetical protein DL765_004122 [Monosporascus sp. GIB2]